MADSWQFVFSGTLQAHVWYHAPTGDRRWPDPAWERRFSNTFNRTLWFHIATGLRSDDCPLARAVPQPQPQTPPEAISAAVAAEAEQAARMEAERQAALERAQREEAQLAAARRAQEEAERKALLQAKIRDEMHRRAQEAKGKAEAELAERRAREEAERAARRANEERLALAKQAAAGRGARAKRALSVSSSSSSSDGALSVSSSSDSSSSSSRPARARKKPPKPNKAAVPKEPKAPLQGWPSPDAFRSMGQDDRDRIFWRFVHEAVLGTKSAEPLCQMHVLGGAACLLPDAQCVAEEVCAAKDLSLREKVWRIVVAIWFGCGGPAFRSFRYVTGVAPMLGGHCPAAARLPPGDTTLRCADLGPMYRHLEDIVRAPGRRPKDVLSGDGRFTMGRFGAKQGLEMLNRWRDAVCQLVDPYHTDEELRTGLERIGPTGVDRHFREFPGWRNLAIKELFTYMELLLPRAFDSNEFVPFGDGARFGARFVLGDLSDGEIHLRTRDLLERQPPELADAIRTAYRGRFAQLPSAVQALPGYQARLQGPYSLNVLDVEVCFCWFQAFLKQSVSKWKAFSRDVWKASA